MTKTGKTFGIWEKVDAMDLEQTVGIVINHHTVSSAGPSHGILKHIGGQAEKLSVLDFGSGVGRNAFPLSLSFENWNIICYDNERMNLKAKEYAREKYGKDISEFKNIEFTSDWEILKNRTFDCIFASLVFQHVKEDELESYVRDMKRMAKKLIVGGRRALDRDVNGKFPSVWKILERNGLSPSFCSDPEKYDMDGRTDHFICVYNFQ